MADQTSDGRPVLGREALAHLLVPTTEVCWWCQERPATTGEHKFKRTDLARLMDDDDELLWGDSDGNRRAIRGKRGITRDRYGIVKFPKSLCETCNNQRSKGMDNAYDCYSGALDLARLRNRPGLDLQQVFGSDWEQQALLLARYYGKHFGCRMTRSGLPVPDSLRTFLNGDVDMPDAHMALVTTDSVRKVYESGLSISPDFAESDRDMKWFVRYVLVAYVGPIGVRYEWRREGFHVRSQFFQYSTPVINRFADEIAVAEGRTRRRRWLRDLMPW